MSVTVGTSGYSYDDWVGPFYPPGLSKSKFLDYYAQHFAAVEVNYTYYRMPNARTLAAMSGKTGPDFQFAIKANSAMTHERSAESAVFSEFTTGLSPLIDEGKLACVLAQFPYSFHPTPDSRDYLEFFHEQLPDLPVVVEFRNAEWVTAETFQLLEELNFAYCCVDQPRLRNLMPPVAVATSAIGYVRFHGRNYQKWWQHEEAWERYDYLYTREELAEWVDKVGQLTQRIDQTYVFFNNHYQAQAVQNAQLFRELLREAGLYDR